MPDRNQHASLNPYLSLLYGGIAGSVAKTVIAPFDRVKIHFQIANPELNEYRGKISATNTFLIHVGRFTGVFGAVKRIYSHSGFFGLYRGHSATLARIFPYAAINFAAFEKFKTILGSGNIDEGWQWRKLLAGSLAGTLAVSATYPFDIIRARVSYDISQHKKYLRKEDDAVFKIVVKKLSKEGAMSQSKIPFRGFYQGFLPTILGIIPYAGVSFFVFESSKQYLRNRNNSNNLSSIQIFASGLPAGALGQTVAYPFDVIRRRMQLYIITDHLPSHHYNSGIINAIKSVIKTHGWVKGVFSGLSINYIKVAPASGVSFLVYETLKNKFPDGLI